MIELVGNKWDNILQEEYNSEYFKDIVNFINKEYKEKVVFPPKSRILRALNLTDYATKTKEHFVSLLFCMLDFVHEDKNTTVTTTDVM